MTIYLDLCALQRPLDRKDQVRIILESEAVLGILAFCATGLAKLISSEILIFEAGKSPDEMRKRHSIAALSLSRTFVKLSPAIELRATALQHDGVKAFDSFHLASAESGNAEYFCTCDDRFIRRAKSIRSVKLKMVTPIELAEEIERWKSK